MAPFLLEHFYAEEVRWLGAFFELSLDSEPLRGTATPALGGRHTRAEVGSVRLRPNLGRPSVVVRSGAQRYLRPGSRRQV